MNLRGWEWVVLLLIVLLLFGARRLPDLARSVGRSMKIFRSEVKDLREDTPPVTPPVAPPSSGPPSTATSAGTTPQAGRATTDDDGERPRP